MTEGRKKDLTHQTLAPKLWRQFPGALQAAWNPPAVLWCQSWFQPSWSPCPPCSPLYPETTEPLETLKSLVLYTLKPQSLLKLWNLLSSIPPTMHLLYSHAYTSHTVPSIHVLHVVLFTLKPQSLFKVWSLLSSIPPTTHLLCPCALMLHTRSPVHPCPPCSPLHPKITCTFGL